MYAIIGSVLNICLNINSMFNLGTCHLLLAGGSPNLFGGGGQNFFKQSKGGSVFFYFINFQKGGHFFCTR